MCCACGGGNNPGGIGYCGNTNVLDGKILSDVGGDACTGYTEANAESWCG